MGALRVDYVSLSLYSTAPHNRSPLLSLQPPQREDQHLSHFAPGFTPRSFSSSVAPRTLVADDQRLLPRGTHAYQVHTEREGDDGEDDASTSQIDSPLWHLYPSKAHALSISTIMWQHHVRFAVYMERV